MFFRRIIFVSFCVLLSACVFNPNFKDEKGSYKGSYYEVNQGDTLYFVSYITDRDAKDLIAYNRLSAPYTLQPGQVLKLWGESYQSPVYGKDSSSPAKTQAPLEQSQSSGYVNSTDTQDVSASTNTQVPATPSDQNSYDQKISKWVRPTTGQVVKAYSLQEQGNRGIDIKGELGQDVVSTANGTVVYAGDALKGYGNLLIIKHNEEYLSAYAHNQTLYVKEGEHVTAGQKIATMGQSGTDSVKLHFEIRYKGKPVNPELYLSQ